jgi:hypothetical protein
MEPTKLAYDICRCYLSDLDDVDAALIAKIDGFRRSRNLAALASCSQLFDQAKHSIKEWRALRQVEAFFKKNALFAHKDKCRDAAQQSFTDSEERCHATNVHLKTYVGYTRLLDEPYQQWVIRMQHYISSVLGDFHFFLESLPFLVRVTPGATSYSSRVNSLPQMKMRMKIFATQRSSQYLKSLYHYYGFRIPRIKTTHSNRVELVPKNWKTDRTIACEPEGNLPLQLAFDSYAKRRLRRFGIDLRDQSANQRAAKHASINNDYVTVDFSKASDTISYNTVSLVFPVEWFDYLNRVRTPGFRGVFGDGVYAKFSSMGNGSTFCIETLLFAAACKAVGSNNFLVYGDDVIIEKEYYEDFLCLTRFLGFSINVDKSFSDGPFRESCGKDYYDGIDVTPVYIRNIDKRKASLCHLINSLGSIVLFEGSLERLLFDLIKEYNLPLVPYNENTMSGIWIDPDKARALRILYSSHQVSYFRSYTAKYKRKFFVDSRGYYLWFLNKNSQVLFSGPFQVGSSNLQRLDQGTETSAVAVYDHMYVRKRVCWFRPATGMPDHLYSWSERLTPG